MRSIRPKLSFRAKLLVGTMVTSSASLILAAAGFVVYEHLEVRRSLVREASGLAELTGSSGSAALVFGQSEDAREALSHLAIEGEVLGARLYDAEGSPFATWERDAGSAELPDRVVAEVSEYRGDHLRIAREVRLDGERIGWILLDVSTSRAWVMLKRYASIAVGVLVLATGAAFLLATCLGRAVVAPILDLSRAARQVTDEENYSLRVAPQNDDEVGVLVDGFNKMLARIQVRDMLLQESRDRLEEEVAARTGELRKLTRAVEQTSAIILITDLDGVIEYVNPRFSEVTGFTPAEALGRTPSFLKSGLQDAGFYEELWSTIRGGEVWRGEIQNRTKSGEVYWEFQTISPVRSPEGIVTHYVAVKEDISERKRAERELEAAKEAAETASRAKSEFLATMSHEIRTPMNGVIGMTELALETELTADQRECLEMVRQSADSLLTIINDVLDFSKIEAGRLELDEVEFDVHELVGKIGRRFMVECHRKGLELICDVAPDVPRRVRGDPSRVQQVIVNLLGNALKFTQEGEIVVSVSSRRLEEEEVLLEFSVRDTGIGIKQSVQARIFEAFSQADGSMTRRYGGTGLGLSISTRLVAMMGGEIGVESEPGRGSEFRFTARLRRGAKEEREEGAATDEAPWLGGRRCLLVVSNRTRRRILEDALRSWRVKTVACSGIDEADEHASLSRKEGEPFALAVVDDDVLTGREETPGDGLRASHWADRWILMAGIGRASTDPSDTQGDQADSRGRTLRKPVTRSDLQTAIAELQASADEQAGGQTDDAPSPEDGVGAPDRERDGRRGLSVLLAEDNVVNQRLAVRVLEAEGCRVVVAGSGREAVEAYRSGAHDFVLMDVHMPEMDGLEATRRIREMEAERGDHVPIVALTANAMQGDRERCIEAGMDEYLSKPVSTKALRAMVARLGARARDEADSEAEADMDQTAALDETVLLDQCDDDMEFAREIARDFLDLCPEQCGAIETGIRESAFGTVCEAAHSLKGAAGNIGARPFAEVAARLEAAAKAEDAVALGACQEEFRRETARVVAALEEFSERQPS